MAGAGLASLKQRIKTITNIKKITNAMNVVANSKLRVCRKSLQENNKYYSALDKVMGEVNSACMQLDLDIVKNNSNKKLYIVITSDTGLCGGFNSQIVNETMKYVKDDINNSIFILVGQKGRGYFKRYNLKTTAEFVDVAKLHGLEEAETIFDCAFKMYQKGEVKEVSIIFTQFISAVKRNVVIKKMLPFDTKSEVNVDNIEFEPSAQDILTNNLKNYLSQMILNCLLNSKTSEQSFRADAMYSSTKNANDLIEKLKLKYNRIRQTVITQEISEIVSGAEAQK